MEQKKLIEVCENILKDLQNRVNNRWMYGEDWNVSYDRICDGKYEICIHFEVSTAVEVALGKSEESHFNFKLMENETCTFVVDSNDFETFIEKSLIVINEKD